VYDTTVQVVYNDNCTGCHFGTTPAGGLNLTAGVSHSQTVGVASGQLPTMDRVEPSDPSNSYLWHKINDTHAGVGGFGTEMPPGGSLSVAELQVIEDWINAGATDD
jgi:hypothetical protein